MSKRVFFGDPCYYGKAVGFVLGYIKDLQNWSKLIGERMYREENVKGRKSGTVFVRKNLFNILSLPYSVVSPQVF